MITFDSDRCIGCSKCVQVCDSQGIRVFKNGIGPRSNPVVKLGSLANSDCVGCGQCIHECPAGAIYPYIDIEQCLTTLRDAGPIQYKKKVALLSPPVAKAVAQFYNIPNTIDPLPTTVRILRDFGFTHVFSSVFGSSDMNELDAQEVIRVHDSSSGPVISARCPSVVRLVIQSYPALIPRLMPIRSCGVMLGTVLKDSWGEGLCLSDHAEREDIYTCYIVPCTSKKDEIRRDIPDPSAVDACFTIWELLNYLAKSSVIITPELAAENADKLVPGRSTKRYYNLDPPFDNSKILAYIQLWEEGIGATCMRFVAHKLKQPILAVTENNLVEFNGKVKQFAHLYRYLLGATEYTLLVARGGRAVRHCLNLISTGEIMCDYADLLFCPGGCKNGGGQYQPAYLRGIQDPDVIRFDPEKNFEKIVNSVKKATLIDFIEPENNDRTIRAHYTASPRQCSMDIKE